ncbi:MAG: hypothetical protein JO253_06380 [Alphaproteobacteria bacterium]|nr:hypothetical protein [Alphaproteobacteria bacterium]
MSGGSMNYLCNLVDEANFDTSTPERMAFKRHLKLVAEALHDIEWVDSGDYAPGDENAAIRACMNQFEPLEAAIEMAADAYDMLRDQIIIARRIIQGEEE